MTVTLNKESVEQVADRVVGYLSGASIAGLVHLGDRLGLYRALWDVGPVTSAQLAAATSMDERWVREWLHGQSAAGLVSAHDGRFELTPEQAAVLADEDDPAFAAGGFALLFPLLQRWDLLENAFRTGRGAAYDALGPEHAVGEARFSGPWMRSSLVPVILPQIDGVVEKLTAGARVVDVGCGSGGALIEMAKAFPASEFHGYDSAQVAIRLGRERIERAGLENVTLHHAPGVALPADASCDFILTWDCLHDMSDPAGTMLAIRRAIRPDGAWLIVDINGAPTPEENYSHPLAGMLYSFSVLDCLGCSTAEVGGAALGTLGLPEPVAREMAQGAGFTRFTVRDFGNPLNSFYEVRP